MYSQIIDFDNLVRAYDAARAGKRYRPAVARYSANLEENLINLHNHLVWESWRPKAAREFVIFEPKMRAIQAPPFEDRIVHHALVGVVEPLFERRFIHHSYACRRGKGVHAAIQALQKMLRRYRRAWGSVWVVQADVRQFFATLQHTAVMSAVESAVKCPQTRRLWETVLSGYGHDDGVGIPVGALTSQLSANATLDGVDHEMTDHHGAGRYLRYMDDIIILEPTKQAARHRLEQLTHAVESRGLTLNPKTQVRPAAAGVDWCGYRTWSTHILPRKRNIKRFRRRLELLQKRYSKGEITIAEAAQQVHAFRAYTQHCSAHRTIEHILSQTVFTRSSDYADY